jgi:hypothetical protein
LHPETDSEERNSAFTCEADRVDFAFNATFAKSAGNKNPVIAAEQSFGPFTFHRLAVDASNSNLGIVMHARVVKRFVNRFVGIEVFGIFTHHCDADFMPRISKSVQQIAPIVQIRFMRWEVQLADD